MKRILLTGSALALAAAFIAPVHADELDDTLVTSKQDVRGSQAAFVGDTLKALEASRTTGKLAVDDPFPSATLAQLDPKTGGPSSLYLSRGQSERDAGLGISLVVSKPFGMYAEFRREQTGSVIRHDTQITGNLFGPVESLSSRYSDASGKRIARPIGWLRFKLARAPLIRASR
jgi:hypothetical protein